MHSINLYRKLLIIFLVLNFYACNSTDDASKLDTSSQSSTLPKQKVEWKEFNAINWVNSNPTIVNSGAEAILDLSKKKKYKLETNRFTGIKQAHEFNFSLNDLPSEVFNLERLEKKSLDLKTSKLGAPKILKASSPQMRLASSDPVLILNKDQNIIDGNIVNCMTQDKYGRLWIGTNEGLSIYDGENNYTYKTYQGLSDNRVWSIVEDNEGLIWIGTFFGYDVIDIHENTISHVNSSDWLQKNYGFGIAKDSSGLIWLATVRGLYIVNKKENWIRKFDNLNGLASNNARTLFVDHKQNILVGTNAGITFINTKENHFKNINSVSSIGNAQIYSICQDSLNTYYIASSKGLYFFKADDAMFKLLDKSSGLIDDDMRSLSISNNKILNIGTRNAGLIQYNVLDHSVRIINEKNGLNTSLIQTQFIDRDNQLWLGGFFGLNLLKSQFGDIFKLSVSNGLGDRNYSAVLKDNVGRIWIGGASGIDILNEHDNTIIKLLPSDYLVGTSACLKLYQDSRGLIYIASNGGGLSVYNPITKKVKNYGQEQGIANYGVIDFIEDKNGKIWILTMDGLNIFDPVENTLEYSSTENGFPDDVFTAITSDYKNNLWISANTGAYKVDVDNRKVYGLDIMNAMNSKRVNDIYADDAGRTYIASNEDGLYIYDDKFDSVMHLTTDQGLLDITVKSIAKLDSKIYIGTNKGLSVFEYESTESYKLTNYNRQQGMPSIDFLANSTFVNQQELWFGMLDGILILKPSIIPNRNNKTYISSISINGEKYFRKEASSSNSPYGIPQYLELPYSKNQIYLSFTGNYINDQDQAKYKFVLEGLDNRWTELSKNNFIDFRNLAPGEYLFRVTSCGLNGICGIPAEFRFKILPPWWATYWFYSICLVIVAGSIIAYNRYRVNQFKIQTRKLELKVDERTRQFKEQKERAEKSEQMEKQFLANMSHEIRTPMNAVMGMTNILIEKNPNEEQLAYLQNIKKSSENLLVILNDILDLSKISEGKLELEAIDISIYEILNQVNQLMYFKAEEKGLKLEFNIDQRIQPVLIGDPTRLNQILVNLTGNAIKFTEFGKVSIQADLLEPINQDFAIVKFSIKDTGIGMEEKQLNRIFESFTQASEDTTRKFGGTGLGLTISKNLVEKYNSSIKVKSKLNEGSEFYFEIKFPISKSNKVSNTYYEPTSDIISKLEGITILLAEDNEFNRIVVIDTLKLKLKNIKIDVAENGLEAVELATKNKYDIILMDIQMPEMNGLQASNKIRTFDNQTPIIALTAAIIKTELEKIKQHGMNAYISKPFKVAELILGIFQGIYPGKLDMIHNPLPIEVSSDSEIPSGLIDLTFLKDFCKNDKKKMLNYIEMFQSSTPTFIENVRNALNQNNVKKIEVAVHSIRPHLNFMGIHTAKSLAEEIEIACAELDTGDDLNVKVNQLLGLCEEALKELEDISF